MPRVATFVFFDTETTGLPALELNRTRITELCLLAVRREHVLAARAPPRVQHKLTLCLYPRRQVSEDAARLTGLSNELLEHEPVFDLETYRLLNSFLSLLAAPVCLVAHNGLGFDYPILQNHLRKLAVSFTCELLCADSYHGFYDILENRKQIVNVESPQAECEVSVAQGDASLTYILQNGTDTSPSSKKLKLSDEDVVDLPSPAKPVEDEFYANNLHMKAINESTPKKNKWARKVRPNAKLCRRMPWVSGVKPAESYKLEDIYARVLGKKPETEAHQAENDCLFALEISAALSEDFVNWVDANCVPFSEVQPMTPGVRLGF